MSKILLLLERHQLDSILHSEVPQEPLLMVFEEGLGGAWTDCSNGIEVIRFGYPTKTTSPWFRLYDVPTRGHNAATLALERILFVREIHQVICGSHRLEAVARHGARVHPGTQVSLFEGDDVIGSLPKVMEGGMV